MTHNTPGFEANMQAAADFLGSLQMDAQPSKGCPVCECKEDPGTCSGCGLLMCPQCELDPDRHVRCLPPERMKPYLLLQDCEITLGRVKKALRDCNPERAFNIADNMEKVLSARAIR